MSTVLDYIIINYCKYQRRYIAVSAKISEQLLSKYCHRKLGINDDNTIKRLENVLGVPANYWLDEKPEVSGKQIRTRYAKKLTQDAKSKVDSYYSSQYYEEGALIENEIRYNPYIKQVISIDTDIVFDEMESLLHSIVYAQCDEEFYSDEMFFNRALSLKETLELINEIGIDNTDEYNNALKEQRFKPIGMTEEEQKEYLELFCEIAEENTSE